MTRQAYYNNIDILFELIHQLRFKECMFIPYKELDGKMTATRPVRWLNAQYVNMLKRHFEHFRFLEKSMNIYCSSASYKDFPTFAYNWRMKSEQQKIWMDSFQDYIKGYDLFLETDSDELYPAITDAIELKKFLDSYHLKYYIKFSGSKGIHFISPYEEFTHINVPIYDRKGDTKDLVSIFKEIAEKIKLILDLETMDTSVQDIKRVSKLAYSWDVKSNLIAYPMTDSMLDNFDRDFYEPKNIIRQRNHKRGLLWRGLQYDKDDRQKNIIRLLKDLNISLQKEKN